MSSHGLFSATPILRVEPRSVTSSMKTKEGHITISDRVNLILERKNFDLAKPYGIVSRLYIGKNTKLYAFIDGKRIYVASEDEDNVFHWASDIKEYTEVMTERFFESYRRVMPIYEHFFGFLLNSIPFDSFEIEDPDTGEIIKNLVVDADVFNVMTIWNDTAYPHYYDH